MSTPTLIDLIADDDEERDAETVPRIHRMRPSERIERTSNYM